MSIDQRAIRDAAAQAIRELPDEMLAAMVRAADTNTVLSLTWKTTEAPPEAWPHTERVVQGNGGSRVRMSSQTGRMSRAEEEPVEDPAADLPDEEKDDDDDVEPITKNANDDEEEGSGEPPPEITDRDIKPENITHRDPKPVNEPEPEDIPAKIATSSRSGRPADGTATATETEGGWQGGMWVSGGHVTIGPVFPTKEAARRYALANPPHARRTPPPADGLNPSKRGELGRMAVLKLIEEADPDEGVSSRAISEATGLNAPRVSNHLQRLKSMGLVRLVGARRTARWFPCN